MNSTKPVNHDLYPITEGTTFTFIIYGCDKEGFSGIRDWTKSHTLDYALFGYSDNEFSMPQNIRGYYALATASSLSNFQNTLISAIHAGGGLYSRISCEMDQLDFEIAHTWCSQLPYICEIGTRPRSWSNEIPCDIPKMSESSSVQQAMDDINEDENNKTKKFTLNWTCCNDCDIDFVINR